ncbi:MAG: glycosyltransferase family 4 protein, partial [Candidatus Omnitrophica bacterium]|nr:glycosyltransferase family 4 protein [Candidatus Omnitrophota bacterium]
YLKCMIYEIKACEKFDKVITMTQHERDILRSFSSKINAEYVPMGVDTGIFKSNSHIKEESDITYVGFFRHYPNVDAVRYFTKDIYPLIKKRLPEARFNIVGFDPPDEISKMDNIDGIRVTGHVEDIRPFLYGTKVFIMPIRLGMGMRGKLFEAWAMEKAVVSTSIGCEGVEIEDNKNIMVADTPEDFAVKTVELIKDDDKRRELGVNARKKTVSKYDWDVLTKKLEDIYKGLV